MLALLVAAALAAYFIYRYYENEKHYWTRKGIPGPPATWLWGNLHELVDYNKPRSLVMKEWTQKYGKVYGFHEGQRKQMVISDLKMMEEMLTKKFDHFHSRAKFALQPNDEGPKTHIIQASGQHWRRLRSLGSPAFSNNALKQIQPTVEHSSLLMIQFLEKAMDKGEVNMLEYYQEFTIDIISKLALGKKDVKMFQNPYLAIARDVFARNVNTPIFNVPNLFPFLNTPWRIMLETIGRFFGIAFLQLIQNVEKVVEERKRERAEGKESSNDFIDMFLDAEVETAEIRFNEEDKEGISRRLAFDEVVGQCLVFLLAGFETTANSLSYATHFLANHPDVQEKLHDEIDAVCTEEEVSYDQLAELKYTECVIKESLRHYPLASIVVSRECAKSTQLGDYFIEKGTQVQTDTWSMHMDEQVWGNDAKEFRPERWLETGERSRLAFQSFGEGPRMCLGMRLAYMEEKILLVHLIRRFRFLKSEHTNPIKLVGSITVSPHEVMVRVERRST